MKTGFYKTFFIGISILITDLYVLVSAAIVDWLLASSNNKGLNLLSVVFGILLLIRLFKETRRRGIE